MYHFGRSVSDLARAFRLMGEGAYDRLHARVGDALAHDLEAKKKGTYVDNRRDAGKAEVRRAHRAGESRGTRLRVVDPEHAGVPLAASPDLTLTPIVPPGWPPTCSHDPNDCSIGLRIDFCSSSVLFMGDAEHDEEARLDPHGHVGVLQVAHHGSETSTTPGFLAKTHPSYAVISAGKPGAGLNAEYCHPRTLVVQRLTAVLGGPGAKRLRSFDGDRCAGSLPSDWMDTPVSDRLWATERDGDVVLTTTGDGRFTKRKITLFRPCSFALEPTGCGFLLTRPGRGAFLAEGAMGPVRTP